MVGVPFVGEGERLGEGLVDGVGDGLGDPDGDGEGELLSLIVGDVDPLVVNVDENDTDGLDEGESLADRDAVTVADVLLDSSGVIEGDTLPLCCCEIEGLLVGERLALFFVDDRSFVGLSDMLSDDVTSKELEELGDDETVGLVDGEGEGLLDGDGLRDGEGEFVTVGEADPDGVEVRVGVTLRDGVREFVYVSVLRDHETSVVIVVGMLIEGESDTERDVEGDRVPPDRVRLSLNDGIDTVSMAVGDNALLAVTECSVDGDGVADVVLEMSSVRDRECVLLLSSVAERLTDTV